MKLQALSFACLISASAFAQAQPANLSYDYINIEAGIGKLKVKQQGSFDYRSTNFYLSGATMLDANSFVELAYTSANADDRDRSGATTLELDTQNKGFSAVMGYAIPFAQSSDFVLRLGAAKTDQKSVSRGAIGAGPFGARQIDKDNETGVVWGISTRTLFAKGGFELELDYQRFKDQKSFSIGGPAYLSKNLGLNIAYTHTMEKTAKTKTSNGAITVGLRYYF